LGYIALGLATSFAVPLFANEGELQKWLRWFFLVNGLIIPLIALVYFYPDFSITLLLLGLPWIITAPGLMSLLSLFLGEDRNYEADITNLVSPTTVTGSSLITLIEYRKS